MKSTKKRLSETFFTWFGHFCVGSVVSVPTYLLRPLFFWTELIPIDYKWDPKRMRLERRRRGIRRVEESSRQRRKQSCLCWLASRCKSSWVKNFCDKYLFLCWWSLDLFAAERSEEASKALAAKREYKSRIEQISKDFEEEQRQTFEITQDMTRQYKGMQEELLTRVRDWSYSWKHHLLRSIFFWMFFRSTNWKRPSKTWMIG